MVAIFIPCIGREARTANPGSGKALGHTSVRVVGGGSKRHRPLPRISRSQSDKNDWHEAGAAVTLSATPARLAAAKGSPERARLPAGTYTYFFADEDGPNLHHPFHRCASTIHAIGPEQPGFRPAPRP